MPINIKALLFILTIGGIVFWFAARYARNIAPQNEIYRWRNIWFIIQITAFLSPNIWLFYGITAFTCLFIVRKSPENRVYAYALLLGSVPILSQTIPGFGIINYLFTLNFPRVLILFLLVPTYFYIRQTIPKAHRQLNSPTDKFIILFLLLISLLAFRDHTFTNAVRYTFLIFIDYFVVYYVISRTLTTKNQLNKILLILLISISISASIGIFETIKDWHIYNHLVQHLQDKIRLSRSDIRGGYLRSAATFGSPIVLGYVVTIGLGIIFYLAPIINNKVVTRFLFLSLLTALFTTVSRGPWVGFAFLYLAYIWTGKDPLKQYSKSLFGLIILLPVLIVSPFGKNFIDLLPFIGTIRSDTVDYRSQLLEQALLVFHKYPFFGFINFRETPEMQVMLQGEGIVDVVNSYIGLALSYGIFGLILFLAIFLSLLIKCYTIIKLLPKEEHELIRLGRALFSILAAVMLIIYTVSSVSYVPSYFWTLFGITSAYLTICNKVLSRHRSLSDQIGVK